MPECFCCWTVDLRHIPAAQQCTDCGEWLCAECYGRRGECHCPAGPLHQAWREELAAQSQYQVKENEASDGN